MFGRGAPGIGEVIRTPAGSIGSIAASRLGSPHKVVAPLSQRPDGSMMSVDGEVGSAIMIEEAPCFLGSVRGRTEGGVGAVCYRWWAFSPDGPDVIGRTID